MIGYGQLNPNTFSNRGWIKAYGLVDYPFRFGSLYHEQINNRSEVMQGALSQNTAGVARRKIVRMSFSRSVWVEFTRGGPWVFHMVALRSVVSHLFCVQSIFSHSFV